MIAINLNSKIINAASPDAPISYRLLWRMGFDRALQGGSYFDCLTTAERNGYRAAIDACAETEMPGYAQKMGW